MIGQRWQPERLTWMVSAMVGPLIFAGDLRRPRAAPVVEGEIWPRRSALSMLPGVPYWPKTLRDSFIYGQRGLDRGVQSGGIGQGGHRGLAAPDEDRLEPLRAHDGPEAAAPGRAGMASVMGDRGQRHQFLAGPGR